MCSVFLQRNPTDDNIVSLCLKSIVEAGRTFYLACHGKVSSGPSSSAVTLFADEPDLQTPGV